MKIFLPFKVKDIGGTSTFARKFKAGMEAFGHEVTYDYTPDYDILFLIVQCPLKYVIDAKRRNKKIVQRMDGTYYWTVSGWRFPFLNAKATYIRHFFTDFTVYQSEYSRECANRFLGKKLRDQHAIIYNGVDLKTFSDAGGEIIQRDNPDQKIFFTASAFRRKDQILPLLDALKEYQVKDRNFKLYIAGTFVHEVKDLPDTLKSLNFVTLLGKVANKELPMYERSADVFLFTHLNPPCPNNVIEALACGLPICGVGDGAMHELVAAGKTGELVEARGTGFWRKRLFDSKHFADNLYKIVSEQKKYSAHSASVARKSFSLDHMTEAYVHVMELLVK